MVARHPVVTHRHSMAVLSPHPGLARHWTTYYPVSRTQISSCGWAHPKTRLVSFPCRQAAELPLVQTAAALRLRALARSAERQGETVEGDAKSGRADLQQTSHTYYFHTLYWRGEIRNTYKRCRTGWTSTDAIGPQLAVARFALPLPLRRELILPLPPGPGAGLPLPLQRFTLSFFPSPPGESTDRPHLGFRTARRRRRRKMGQKSWATRPYF